jgi:uroporphyrinogen decarboxylase
MGGIAEAVPPEIILAGNLPTHFFEVSDLARFRRHMRAMLEFMAAYPNYVPSSACDLPPKAKRDNVNAFFEIVEKYQLAA